MSTLLLKHDDSKCSEHKAKCFISRPVCACDHGEGRPFLFLFCLLLESMNRNPCAGMVFATYIIWPTATQYCVPTFFLLFLDLASPSISLVLQPEVKSRMRPSYCAPSCDVTKLADRASRVHRKLGSNTHLFLAL